MSSEDQVRRYTRIRTRRGMLDVDLNSENRDNGDPSNHTRSQDRHVAQGVSTMLQSIDVEALDDDVVISSRSAFAEAKNNSRRVREHTIVVDLDSDDRSARNKRRRISTNQIHINCDLCINLDGSGTSKGQHGPIFVLESRTTSNCSDEAVARTTSICDTDGIFIKPDERKSVQQTVPSPPKEPTFSCPVCMGALVEETSTKCGHIFCKACIKAAIAAQSKCPTCRRKTTAKDIFRIYLPASRIG